MMPAAGDGPDGVRLRGVMVVLWRPGLRISEALALMKPTSAIADRLAAVLGAERVPVWLNKPVPALEHRKPIDVIAAGGYEQVSRVVAELESPTFG